MGNIKKMKIHGFKKFKDFDMEFNSDINIIIGENESGKSSILEAINITISQLYKNFDKYIVKQLLNHDLILEFQKTCKLEDLPFISIDIEFDDVGSSTNSILFYGTNHSWNDTNSRYGIRFLCKLPDDMVSELLPLITAGEIPYDYYQMSWNTFQGDQYSPLKKLASFLLIDNDNIDSNNSFNYYNKTLFASNHNNELQAKIKNNFRLKFDKVFSELPINNVSETQKFGLNEKKLIFENLITIFDDDIQIENKGKGKENIIKTQIALNKKSDKFDIVAIEEPENHLSYTNLRKMIEEIKKHNNSQLIITTHESMIVNSLNLKKIIWIKQDKAISLSNIDKDDADFFLKSSNNNMLQFILSPKVILVEGPTENLLIPKIFSELYSETLEENNISIIECSGIKYKRYLGIANKMSKKVAVLTDNDSKQNNIDYMTSFNGKNADIKIFMDNNINNWTWEQCFYSLNTVEFDSLIKTDDEADYLFHKLDYGKTLGKMLNNKVETAYIMIKNKWNYNYPQYIKDALKWIKE